jgi:methylated-DNA-[protein]-cysteine S-methyltransferase
MQAKKQPQFARQTDVASTWAVGCTPLGWIGIAMRDKLLQRLSFGHRSAVDAAVAVGGGSCFDDVTHDTASNELLARLCRYAEGEFDDFLDIPTCTGHLTPFAVLVVKAVRHIPFGKTLSYAQIAAEVGHPRAARAVGTVMAQNRTPLVVPCHRVVASKGKLGGYSGVDGVLMKRRLLDLEKRFLAVF